MRMLGIMNMTSPCHTKLFQALVGRLSPPISVAFAGLSPILKRVGWFYVFCLPKAHILPLGNNQETLDSALFLECEFVEQDGPSGLEYSIEVI